MKFSIIGLLFAGLVVCHAPRALAGQSDLLGDEFQSVANGIALRPPASCTRSDTPSGEVAEFTDEQHHWLLRVRRLSFARPLPLSAYKDQFGQDQDGLMELTLRQFRDQPATRVIAHDVIHVGQDAKIQAGIIAVRYAQNFEQHLMQEALVRANDRLYYTVDLVSLARADADTGRENPQERLASDAFNQVVDSVRLLDRTAIYQDQADRLIRTRGLLANWTPQFLASRLVGEQFFRLIRDGSDIGYVYEIEEFDDKSGRIGGAPVVCILQRSASAPVTGTVVDAQSRSLVTTDLKHEDWVNLVLVTNQPGANEMGEKRPPTLTQITEVGVSDQRSRAVPLISPGGGLDAAVNAAGSGAQDQTIQPGLRMAESWKLTVTRSSADALHPSIKHDLPVFEQDLPAFYIPQALAHILPRLLIDLSPKTYLFASYVADGDNGSPAVMLRYMDVLAPAEATLGGRLFTAVPVKDHIGLEGAVTTHYLNPDDGSYLGSIVSVSGKDGTTISQEIVPTDAATLRKLWPNCNLTRPDRIVDAGAAQ